MQNLVRVLVQNTKFSSIKPYLKQLYPWNPNCNQILDLYVFILDRANKKNKIGQKERDLE